MIDSILGGLRQPEYVHVLLNPLSVYGLLVAWIGLLIAFFSKSRRAQVATLVHRGFRNEPAPPKRTHEDEH